MPSALVTCWELICLNNYQAHSSTQARSHARVICSKFESAAHPSHAYTFAVEVVVGNYLPP
eukprot:2280301-Pleurochrysis_carterae.AAC.1